MFTGIVETMGEVLSVDTKGNIVELTIQSPVSDTLHVDQSVSHDGVCLTVVSVNGNQHVVQLVQETCNRSTFKSVQPGDHVNLERAMSANGRFEGHLVQGHVDCTGEAMSIQDGVYWFKYPGKYGKYLVEKGSICINGVSLTIAALDGGTFSVAIIPHTYGHTTFGTMHIGDLVNLEFDILGKYVLRMLEERGMQTR